MSININKKQLWVEDKPFSLLSGEIHYWRLNPHYWRDALRRARDMGLEIIATYICWEHHEIAEDQFDFHGKTDPARNLVAFLDIVAEEGLRLLIRPGPYIYSEWVNGGVPDRAARYHRLHPEFQKASATYMKAVTDVIKPYLASQGGPIIMLQAENEPDPWPHIYETQLGMGQMSGIFQDFLRQQYGEIDKLNALWETQLIDFDQARAVIKPTIKSHGYLNRYLDFIRFRHWYTGEVIRWTVDKYRELGVDVPIFANVYMTNGIQNWRQLEETCDLCGPDLYPSNEFQAGRDQYLEFMHLLRYTRTYSALPYIPEFQAGIWHGGEAHTGVLTPNHYSLICYAALLAGIAGWNWYMLVDRDNWMMSPINEWGRIRPDLYQTFAEIVTIFKELNPPELVKLTSTSVTVDTLHKTARLEDSSDILLGALYQADIDYECYDIETGKIAKSLLFYAGGTWLSREKQEQLLDYVNDGGNLVFFQDLPTQDDTFSPLNLLDLHLPEGIISQRISLHLGEERVTNTASFFSYDSVPGEAILAERIQDAPAAAEEMQIHCDLPVGNRYIVGYQQTRGKGSIICLGVRPEREIVLAIHRWLDVAVHSQARLPHINSALFRRGTDYYLIAVNIGDDDCETSIKIAPELFQDGQWTAENVITGQEIQLDCKTGRLWCYLSRKNGTVIKISPKTQ
jgi:hypothetical protein